MATYFARIEKRGSAIALVMPDDLVEATGYEVGDRMMFDVLAGQIAITPIPRGQPTLDELLADCTPEQLEEMRTAGAELDWGPDVGAEILPVETEKLGR